MPNTKSATKKVRVIKKKTLQNQMLKSALKSSIKSYEASLTQEDAQVKLDAFKKAIKKIDQAVAKGILHKNTAARKKSQMATKLNRA